MGDVARLDELAWLDGLGQAELVRTGQVTPRELTEAAIRRAERLNPELNAITTPLYERALAEADGPLPDGPFRGVPFLIKDLSVMMPDTPMSWGSRFTQGWRPHAESVLLTRYRQAGLVFAGLTNVPELGILPTTEPLRFGPARNPWDRERTPGGSSGGAAAAVAAGIVPVAHASDGGGSIRIPAACCGLFGLKPTRGRVSPAPGIYGAGGTGVNHAVTRSVRDSAALLDIASGPAPGDAYWAEPPRRPFLDEVGADPGRLRIAFSTEAVTGTPVGQEQLQAVLDTAQLLTDLGHEVVEAQPPLNGEQLTNVFLTIWASGCAASIDGLANMVGRPPNPDEFEPLTWALAEWGRQIPAATVLGCLAQFELFGRRVGMFMDQFDAWLMPTLAEAPLPLGTIDNTSTEAMPMLQRAAAFCPHTPLANVTGQPAMSVPLYEDEAGLPLGVQFYGRYADEATLIRLASQLEEARPWAHRRPPLSA